MPTRRNFLNCIVGVSAFAPFAATATVPVARGNPGAAPIFLWDPAVTASFGAAGRHVCEGAHLNVALDSAASMQQAKLLRPDAHGRVVVIGRSATVFVVKNLLGPHWRVVVEGAHDRDAPGEHLLAGVAPALSQLASSRQNFSDPYRYASVLAAQTAFATEPRSAVKVSANVWNRSEFVSMLAIPGWSKV